MNPAPLIAAAHGQYAIWWDEALGIGRMKIVGECDEDIARKISEWVDAKFAEIDRPFGVVVDLSENTGTSSKARAIFAGMQRNANSGKVAFIGASTFVRVVVNFIAGAAGTTYKMKHFSTDSEALAWLNASDVPRHG